MSELAHSAVPFAYCVGQRVKCVTGEKGRIFGRWLGHNGPQYGIESDYDGRAILAFESELTLILNVAPWEASPR